MRVGLVPGSFKPYHAGHDALVRRASAENDSVLVVYSTASRSRKGEASISGDAASRIMTEFVAPTLPANIKLVPAGTPVRYVYEQIISEEERFIREGKCDLLTIYADADDISNFKNLERYAPVMMARDQIKFATMTRGADSPLMSGAAMRAAASRGDIAAFSDGLPHTLRPRAREILETLGFTSADDISSLVVRESSALRTNNFGRRGITSAARRKDLLNELYLSCLLYEKKLLLEDTGAYDSWSSSPNLLIKTFVAPFVNAAQATKAATLDFANMASVPIRAIVLKLQGSDAAFKQAMKGYRGTKEKIAKTYWEPVMKASDEALSGDAQLLALALAPQEFLGAKLGKKFASLIGGELGDKDPTAGLIGTLATSGLLPEKWSDGWKRWKESSSYTGPEGDAEDERASEEDKHRIRSRKKLVEDLKILMSIVGASAFDDMDKIGEVRSKIDDALKKASSDAKDLKSDAFGGASYLGGGLLDDVKEYYGDLPDVDTKERRIFSRLVSRINQNLSNVASERSSYGRSSSSRFSESNRKTAAKKQLGAAYEALTEIFTEYAKGALVFTALTKAKTLEELERELRQLNIDVGQQFSEIKRLIQQETKPGVDPKDAFNEAIKTLKAAIAKTIAESQKKAIEGVKEIEKVVGEKGSLEAAALEKVGEVIEFKEVVSGAKAAMDKLTSAIASNGDTAAPAEALKRALAIMKAKSSKD